MPLLADRVQETTSTVGTGTLTLGGAVTGYRTFNTVFSNGNVVFYTIDDGTGNWEVGYGTIGTGTLSRDTVLDSSASGALVSFSAGSKRVFCTAPSVTLLPDQTSNSSKVLSTNGSIPSWITPNAGTVTAVSVSSSNGLAGTSSGGATPALTLSTTVTGVIKGNGTAFSAATAGTDYSAGTSALATGIVKSTTSTGALSIAVAGTDYAAAPTGTNVQLLANNGSGGFSNVTIGSGLSYSTGTLSSTAGGGTVTTVSVVSTNGLAGTVTNATTTPAISLSTTITGVLKGDGTAISAATSGTDYSAGTSALATGIVKSTTTTGALSIATAGTDYSAGTSALATGIVKSTTTTGALSIATAGTDYLAPPSGTAILKANSGGALANATAGTDYSAGTSALATGIVKSTTTTGALSIAVSGTDYAPATSGTSILKGSGSGDFSNATANTDYLAVSNPIATGVFKINGSVSGYVGFQGASAAGSSTYTLPSADGTSGQILSTNGSGTLSWATSSGGVSTGKAIAMAMIFGY